MKNESTGRHRRNGKAAVTTSEPCWLTELSALLRSRQVGKGFALLDETESLWATLDLPHRNCAAFLLALAQWVDVGYRDALFLRRMLDLLSDEARLRLNVVDYVCLRLAETFYMLAVDRTSEAISTLETILRLDQELLDPEMKLLAHLWKARAHRKNADYQKASKDILASLEVASMLPESAIVRAVLQVQHGWIVFQCGDVAGALKDFDEAEEVLRHTDHWIAMGNIASARGRIVRRNGDYARALEHFLCAVKFYEARHPQHQNLARAVTNLAFVKRLLALQIKRHIDSSVTRRDAIPTGLPSNKNNLRALHQQYQQLYRSAIAELQRAESICTLNGHASGLAAAVLNAGYLHLDVGELDLAEQQALQAYEIGQAETIIADKGFDADKRVLEPLQQAGKQAVIPPKANRKVQREYDKELYKARHLIENFFAKLKLFRCIATRYDKTARNFLAAIHLAASTIWLN